MKNLIGNILKDRYVISEFIGNGATADVYKVWDQKRSVYLALKMLHEDLAEDAVFLRRFRREGLALEKLQHPNIVRYYGLEQDDMSAFILMDFIDGITLRSEIFRQRGTSLSSERIIEIMRPLCSALNYAYRQGYVHCDIKPSNIMTRSDGTILLTDFGIAYMTESSTTTTMVGAGTPGYMAPEQIRGESPKFPIDIYSLGIILFEMMTGGERPFTGERAEFAGSINDKIRWEQLNLEPLSLQEKNPLVTPKLEAVVKKCLVQDPNERFLNVMDLFAALQKTLKGVKLGQNFQPIQIDNPLAPVDQVNQIKDSAPASSEEQLPGLSGAILSKSRKQRTSKLIWPLVTGIIALAIIFLLLVPNLPILLPSLFTLAAPATISPGSTAIQTSEIPPVLSTPDATSSASLTPSASVSQANAPALTPEVIPTEAIISVENIKLLKEASRLGRGIVEQAIWSPDGNQIAVASSTGIYFYDSGKLEQINFINTNGWVKHIQFGLQGKTIASLDNIGKIAMWDVASGRQLFAQSADKNTIFSISPDGKYLAYINDNSIEILDAASGTKARADSMCCQNGGINNLIFAPDSQYFATSSKMGLIFIWSLDYWGVYRSFEVPKIPIASISFSPNGKIISSGQKAGDSVIHSWDIYTKEEKAKIKGDYQADFVLFRSNEQIIYAYPSGNIEIWDTKNQQKTLKIENDSSISSLSLSPDPTHNYLLVVTNDMRIRVWDLLAGKAVKEINFYIGAVTSIAKDPAGRYVAGSGLPGVVQLWDINSNKENILTAGKNGRIRAIKFSPDGKILAAGGDDQTVHLWDLDSMKPKVISKFSTSEIYSLAFDPTGKLMAAGDSKGLIVIWDLVNGNQVKTLEIGAHVPVRTLVFNIDSRYLASASEDRIIRVWDLDASQMLNLIRYNEPTGENPPLLFQFDTLASASISNVFLWNVPGWKKINSFRASPIGDFSPDLSLYVYSNNNDSNIHILNLKNGLELSSFYVSPANLTQIVFSQDGKSFLTGGEDGAVRIWKISQ